MVMETDNYKSLSFIKSKNGLCTPKLQKKDEGPFKTEPNSWLSYNDIYSSLIYQVVLCTASLQEFQPICMFLVFFYCFFSFYYL